MKNNMNLRSSLILIVLLAFNLLVNARWFFMDLGLLQSKDNLNLIKKAIQ